MGFANDELFMKAVPIAIYAMCRKAGIDWELMGCNPEKLGDCDYALDIPVAAGESHRIRFTLSGDQIAYWRLRSSSVSIKGFSDPIKLVLFNMLFKWLNNDENVFAHYQLEGGVEDTATSICATCHFPAPAETLEMEDLFQKAIAVAALGQRLETSIAKYRTLMA